jgi:hypothetical protein
MSLYASSCDEMPHDVKLGAPESPANGARIFLHHRAPSQAPIQPVGLRVSPAARLVPAVASTRAGDQARLGIQADLALPTTESWTPLAAVLNATCLAHVLLLPPWARQVLGGIVFINLLSRHTARRLAEPRPPGPRPPPPTFSPQPAFPAPHPGPRRTPAASPPAPCRS